MNERLTPQAQLELPSVGTVLPEGHLNASPDADSFMSQADYYDRSQLKPLMVAAPIADFFNKLSATLQIIVVSTFMIAMVAIPLVCAYAVYELTTGSPNYVVIKNQEEARENTNTESDRLPSIQESTGVRPAS